jgi:hypothetical protein
LATNPWKRTEFVIFQLYLVFQQLHGHFFRFLLRRAQLVKKVTAICMLDLRNIFMFMIVFLKVQR